MPAGELVTNNADGGTGKGLLSVFFAAKLTLVGRNVLFAIAEEAVDTTLVPRLIAAGADLDHVKTVSWQRRGFPDPFRIPDDVPRLERGMANVHLLVVDPLLSHLSSRVNSHTDHEVKRALQPLVDLAHRTGCTVLGNGHFGKDKTRGAVGAAQGSSAFTNTPRLAIAMAYDDEDPDLRVAEVVKSNVGLSGTGHNFRVHARPVSGLERAVPTLEDEGVASKSVNDLLLVRSTGKRVPSGVIQEAIEAALEKGPCDREFLNRFVSTRTGATPDSIYKQGLQKMREDGRARCWKEGLSGGWWWELLAQPSNFAEVENLQSSSVEPKMGG